MVRILGETSGKHGPSGARANNDRVVLEFTCVAVHGRLGSDSTPNRGPESTPANGTIPTKRQVSEPVSDPSTC